MGQSLGDLIQPGDVYLMDKGFYSINLLNSIQAKDAYYITPLHGSSNIYAEKTSLETIPLALIIAKSLKKRGYFDKILFLSKLKIPVRFVAYQLGKNASQKKLRAYLKRCRKAKTIPTEENLARQSMIILITNDFSVHPDVIACLYRLRWQIELVFKSWKSQMKIDYCLGTNPNRIRVLIYSRLIAVTILSLALSPIGLALEANYDKELSLYKAVNWIAQGNRALRILLGDIEIIKSLFRASKKWLCKEDNRARKTTRQRLEELSEENLYAA